MRAPWSSTQALLASGDTLEKVVAGPMKPHVAIGRAGADLPASTSA